MGRYLARAHDAWDATTPDEAIALEYFEPLGTRNVAGVSVDEITLAVGTALVERQLDRLVEEGLLKRPAAEGTVLLTSTGILVATRLETMSAYETVAPLDGVARHLWSRLAAPEQEVFRFFAIPVEGGGVVAARVSDIVKATRTVVVHHVLDGLARSGVLVRRPATATVKLTRKGKIMVAYGDALRRRHLVPIARGRIRRLRRQQAIRIGRRVAALAMALAAFYPMMFEVPLRVQSHAAERVAPEPAHPPISVVDLSKQPHRRAALPNGAPPGDCRRGAEVIQYATLWSQTAYLGEFRHFASFRCGVAWWSFTNDDADYYYGALHVRLHADEYVDDIEVVNDAKTLVGRVTSTISTCVGYDVYLVLPDGSRSDELEFDCDEASPGAGVPVI